jgi:hypothetical protein
MLALNQSADSTHGEQVAAIFIAARICLELHGRITVPEDNDE